MMMVWNGDNYPQEHDTDKVRAADFEPIDTSEIGWGETDGAVSINALAVAKRLNDLLVMVQQLEADNDRLLATVARLEAGADVDAFTIDRLRRESIYEDDA